MKAQTCDDLTAKCKPTINVYLDANAGQGTLYPADINDGSSSSCTIDSYEISENGFFYGSAIGFLCNDIPTSPHTVYLRVTDAAGSEVCETQVTVLPLPPVISDVPADITVSCDNIPPVDQNAVTVTSGCTLQNDITITVSDSRTDGNCPNNYTITRTWTAVDKYNYQSSASQIITVEDKGDPVISNVPVNTTVSCNNVPAADVSTVTVTDNCSTSDKIIVTVNDVRTDGNCPNNYVITRTWTATDECGNSSTAVQVITVEDNVAPSISNVPVNTTVSCNNVPAADPSAVTVTDNCSALDKITVTVNDVRADGNCPNNYTITRTWTATDECGNSSTAVQIITVEDNVEPVISNVPGNVTVSCENLPAADPSAVTVTDNCSALDKITVTVNDVRADGNCPNNYTITRTWTATDECGNSSTAVQVITVEDNVEPVISNVPVNTTVSCNYVPAADPSAVTVTDNCTTSDKITVTVTDVRTDGNCPNNYTITRTWTATDECGNSSTAVQVITVEDNVVPVISNVPASAIVSCNNVPAADPSAVTVTDNCSTSDKITVTVNDVRADGNCPNNYIITRTWTATDECGNYSIAVQNIAVQDIVAPSISNLPGNITVSCDNVPVADPSAVTVTDNCSALDKITVTVNDVRADGNCPNNYTITRTWTATDECNNSSTAVQVITVEDNLGPVISNVPGNATVSCDNVPVADASAVTVTDNCSALDKITVTVNDVRADGNCPNNYTITRTWTATDECNNSSTAVQVITVEDNVVPSINDVPGDATVSCNNVPAADPSAVTVTDNCSASDKIIVTVNDVRADGNCPNNYAITRTWTATDECGNSSTAVQVITVQDNIAPVITGVPANTTVSCDNVPAADASAVTVTDNCSASDKIAVTVNDVRTDGNCPNNYVITRTWTATDECGNSSTAVQVITVEDNVPPVITGVPVNTSVSCDNVPAADASAVTVTDNCSASDKITVTVNDVRTDGNCPNNYIITRTWTATDECGNPSTVVQVITVQDNVAPSISNVPGNTTISCDNVPAADASSVTVTDNCSASDKIIVTVNDVRTDGNCPNNYVITRTWTAIDECGNSSTAVQIITVEDNVAPVISNAPGNTTVSCDNVPAADPSVVTVSDNCSTQDKINVTVNDVRADGNCPNNYTITRTWTATDECGNSSTAVQVITVEDNVAPSISDVPGDATVSCNNVPAADPSTVTVTDNCSASDKITVTVNDVRTDGNCPNNYAITRTWTATDECGNSSTAIQVITVQDNTAPVITGVPANTTVSCDNVPAADPSAVTVTDNCSASGKITVTVNDVRTDGNCPNNYIITRTWTATDECGNSSTVVQVITVQDNTAPVIGNVPVNTTVSCDNVPVADASVVTVTDNCSTLDKITVTVNDIRTDGNCPNNYTITRTWIATDECGNQSSAIQVITVQDIQAPTVNCIQKDTVYLNESGIAVLKAEDLDNGSTDNCSPTLSYTIRRKADAGNAVSSLTFDCNDLDVVVQGYIPVLLFVTDECGNTDFCEVQVLVQDKIAPQAKCSPVTINLDATGNATLFPSQIDAVSADNCGIETYSIKYGDDGITAGQLSFDCSHVGKDNYVTLIVADKSGNKDSCTTVVTVQYANNAQPDPTVSPQNQEICSGDNAQLTLANYYGAGNYDFLNVTEWNWIVTKPSGITGNLDGTLTAGSSLVSQTLTNSIDTVKMLKYSIVPTIYGKCILDTVKVSVWVNPQPKLWAVADTSICNNTSTKIPVYTKSVISSGADVYYGWTAAVTGLPADSISGYIDSGQEYIVGTDLGQTLNNSSYSSRKVKYTLQPSLHLNNRVCPSPGTHMEELNVTVEPTPVVSIIASQDTICNRTTIDINVATKNRPEGQWYSVLDRSIPGNVTIPDVTIPPSTGQFTQEINNTSLSKEDILYTFQPRIKTRNDQVCAVSNDSVLTVTVNPTPVMAADFTNHLDSICFKSGTGLNMESSNGIIVGDLKYDIWDVDFNLGSVENVVTPGIYNFTDGQSGRRAIIDQSSLWNKSSSVQEVTYSVSPAIRYNSLFCSGDTVDYTLYIAPELLFDIHADTVIGGHNVSCYGYDNGRIHVENVVGGWVDNGYSYEWSVAGNDTRTEINQLEAGGYDIIIKDRTHGCASDRKTMVLTQPDELTVIVDVQNPSCLGPTGSIVLTVEGGTRAKGYQYSWEGPEYFTSTDSSNHALRSGLYEIKITDVNGCFLEIERELPRVPSPVPSVTWNESNFGEDGTGRRYNISCHGASDGRMNPVLSVQRIVVYTWEYGGSILKTDTATSGNYFTLNDMLVNNLSAGVYNLSVEDEDGCLYICPPQTIREPSPVVFTSSVHQYANGYEVQCHGTPTGRISISGITGGYGERYGPYEYDWIPKDKGIQDGSPNQTSLYAGDFSVLVRNKAMRENGTVFYCDTSVSFTLKEPDELSVQATIPQYGGYEVACYGQSIGKIDIDVSGGYGNHTYFWTSNDGVVVNPESRNQDNLPAGTYNLAITYGDGVCSVDKSYTLHQPDEIKPRAVVSPITCNGKKDGEIRIDPEGGLPGYTYAWRSPDVTIVNPTQQNQSNLEAGTYWLIITDAGSCVKTTTYEILEPSPITSIIQAVDPTCIPGNDGSITLDPTGGTPGYTFVWSNGQTSKDINGLSPGDYSVVISDMNACTGTAIATINQPVALQVGTTVTSNYNGYGVDCYGRSTGKVDIDIQHGRPPYTYQWYSEGQQVNIDPLNIPSGNYEVEIMDHFNCSGKDNFVITQPEKMRMYATVTDLTCAGGENGSIQVFINGGLTPYKYDWSNGANTALLTHLHSGEYSVRITDNNDCSLDTTIALKQPDFIDVQFDIVESFCPEIADGEVRAIVSGGTPQYTYYWPQLGATSPNLTDVKSGSYVLEVTDAQDCKVTATVEIGYRSTACLKIPNAFSPNDDGINDRWEIMAGDPASFTRYHLRDLYPEVVVEIYSANWGMLLYRSQKGYPEPWDGKYNGKYLPVNSYFYVIRLRSDIKPITGNVTIIR